MPSGTPNLPEIREKSNDGLPEGEILRVNERDAAGRFFIGCLAILVGLYYAFQWHDHGNGVPWWLLPFLGITIVVSGVRIAASSRAGLVVEEDGVIVQRKFTKHDHEWNEVSRFELTNVIFSTPLKVTLVDGKPFRVTGFKANSRSQRQLAEEWVAALNSRVDSHRPNDRRT